MDLYALGWNPDREKDFTPYADQGLVPARIGRQDRGSFVVHTAGGTHSAIISGRGVVGAHPDDGAPAVGDWVALERKLDAAIIRTVLPRSSMIARHGAGHATAVQAVAANVDWLLLVSGLDADFNPRRIERYLAMAWSSGASPAIILNKADLCSDVDERVAEVESLATGVPVHALSAAALDPDHALRPYGKPGKTLALVGSSGAGKSTLINALLGESRQRTRDVRHGDDHGRHTTTWRELFLLPGGGVVIDTPGMRELQLWAEPSSLDAAFSDIDGLSPDCRFSDCTHTCEPGCAVVAAVVQGELDRGRLDNYLKLQRELQHLERRRNHQARLKEKARWKSIHKEMRRMNHKRSGR